MFSSTRFRTWQLSLLCMILATLSLYAQDGMYNRDIQGIFGATLWQEDDMVVSSTSSDGSETSDATFELSTMPTLGGAASQMLGGDAVRFGWEAGGLFSWDSDSSAALVNNGTVVVNVDSSMMLLDLFFGLRSDIRFGEHIRMYAAIGPLLLIGRATTESDPDDSTWDQYVDSKTVSGDAGIGIYGRLGIDFVIPSTGMIGFSARALSSELDFGEDSLGEVTFNGFQPAVTFTKAW